ncbi:MAG: type III pantothenate kinase [Betaproteobacteria bacterium]
MPLLALDVGNTRLKWALFIGGTMRDHGALILEEISTLNATQWKSVAAPDRIIGSNVAGDAVRHRVEDQLARWKLEPEWIVSQAVECGVMNGYDRPGLLGPDRWAALIAARRRVPGDPALIITVGTAVTMDALDDRGTFVGGLIVPGFGLMLDALEAGTAGLRVPSGEFQNFPTNTSNALMSGGVHALAGAAERMSRLLAQRTGRQPRILLAGGAAPKLAPHLSLTYTMVDNLVLEGLALIAEAQQRGAQPRLSVVGAL